MRGFLREQAKRQLFLLQRKAGFRFFHTTRHLRSDDREQEKTAEQKPEEMAVSIEKIDKGDGQEQQKTAGERLKEMAESVVKIGKGNGQKQEKKAGQRLKEIAESMGKIGGGFLDASKSLEKAGQVFLGEVKGDFSNAGDNFTEVANALDKLVDDVTKTDTETVRLDKEVKNVKKNIASLWMSLGGGVFILFVSLVLLKGKQNQAIDKDKQLKGSSADIDKELTRLEDGNKKLRKDMEKLVDNTSTAFKNELEKAAHNTSDTFADIEKQRLKLEEGNKKFKEEVKGIMDCTSPAFKQDIEAKVEKIARVAAEVHPVGWKEKLIRRISEEQLRLQDKYNDSLSGSRFFSLISWGRSHKLKIHALGQLKKEINGLLTEKETAVGNKLSDNVRELLKDAYYYKENEDKDFSEGFLKLQLKIDMDPATNSTQPKF